MTKAQKLIEVLSNLSEVKLSRIWQHIENNGQFGVISASRFQYTKAEKQNAHMELKKAVRGMGYGYIEMKGGFVETTDDGIKLEVEEDTLFIPKILKKEIIDLGIANDQDSVLFKDSSSFSEVGTSKRKGIGKVLTHFKVKGGREDLEFAAKLLKKYFSSLKKGAHKGKKFLFKQISEKVHTGMSQVYSQKLDDEWMVIIYGNRQ